MKDLSDMAKGSLSMSSSMAGGNVLSDPPKFGAPGSRSEQTADVPWEPQYCDPEPVIGTPSTEHTDTKITGHGAFRVPAMTWKKVT